MNERCSLCRRAVPFRHLKNLIEGVDDIITVFDNIWHIIVRNENHVLAIWASIIRVERIREPHLSPAFLDTPITCRVHVGRILEDTRFDAAHDRRMVRQDLTGFGNAISGMKCHNILGGNAALSLIRPHAFVPADVARSAGVSNNPARTVSDPFVTNRRARQSVRVVDRLSIILIDIRFVIITIANGYTAIRIPSRRSSITNPGPELRFVFEKFVELRFDILNLRFEVSLSPVIGDGRLRFGFDRHGRWF